jgi:hypothetical protein
MTWHRGCLGASCASPIRYAFMFVNITLMDNSIRDLNVRGNACRNELLIIPPRSTPWGIIHEDKPVNEKLAWCLGGQTCALTYWECGVDRLYNARSTPRIWITTTRPSFICGPFHYTAPILFLKVYYGTQATRSFGLEKQRRGD